MLVSNVFAIFTPSSHLAARGVTNLLATSISKNLKTMLTINLDVNFSFGKMFKRNKEEQTFASVAQQVINDERPYKSNSTIENYLTALRSFNSFAGESLLMGEITQLLMERYQQHLKAKGVCLNTISCYMRSLRTVYNMVVAKEKMKVCEQPFATVFVGKTKTQKRSITDEDILRIQQLVLPVNSYLKLCQDTLLFSLYALGMPFVDIAYLRRSQMSNGIILYYRHKTKQPVYVKIEPCIQEIIDRYSNPESKYVFPFVTSENQTKATRQYLTSLGRYNRELKRIAAMAGVSANVTSYTMRHTWASLAFRNNIDLPVISKALGHTNTNTTITYIREIDDAPVAEANRKLLEKLHRLTPDNNRGTT